MTFNGPKKTAIQGALILALTAAFLSRNSAAEPAKQQSSHVIRIKGFRFDPDRLEVASGDRVTWTNEDIVPHTATAKKAFDSKGLDQGQSWTFVAKQKGDFAYICTYHPTMKGQLVVK